ncbi:MAG: glycosyltransferase family 61 protein [Bacteroidetes bacterium]|nr:glycosyltransferase family 61 protein [Bacteroidota bacterium]
MLPAHLKEYSFVVKSLELFPDNNIRFIPDKYSILKIKNLHLIEQKPRCEEYDPELITKFAKYIKEKVNLHSADPLMKKIYISRKNAGRRTLSNEDDVINVFKKFGYSILNCENLSLNEQISIFSNASTIASLHGAGLTNMIWMEKGSKVLEMHREIKERKDHHSFVYFTLASSLSLDYYYIWCQNDNYSDFFEGVLQVNIDKLETVLNLMNNE